MVVVCCCCCCCCCRLFCFGNTPPKEKKGKHLKPLNLQERGGKKIQVASVGKLLGINDHGFSEIVYGRVFFSLVKA